MIMALSYYFLVLLVGISNVCYGDPSNSSLEHQVRNPLFPLVVQDFAVDVVVGLDEQKPGLYAIPKAISKEEIFSLFYNLVYNSQVKAANPNPKFHALSKAKSIEENYGRIDGEMLVRAATYTAGEILLQAEILTTFNQKSLSSLLVQDFVSNLNAVMIFPSVQNYISALHRGYENFLRNQDLGFIRIKPFSAPAVYVEVINALCKNYQIPYDTFNP